MTDENLDKLMRKVLIDALRMEWSDALNENYEYYKGISTSDESDA